jgi:hypothetical protein
MIGRVMRYMRSVGYERQLIAEKTTNVKFNIDCWAFKGDYNYVLSPLGEDKTFVTILTEYRANYSFVSTVGKLLSFIMDGQHDHSLEIIK